MAEIIDLIGLWLFSLLGFATLALQIGCFIHAIKTHRSFYWFWVLFAFPMIGAIAYIFIEVRPNLKRINWRQLQWQFASRESRIDARRAQLEHSPTLRNRYLLADELQAGQRYDEACQVLEEGRQGVFSDDPDLMLRISECMLEMERFDEAHRLLEAIEPSTAPEFMPRYQLARARALAGVGQNDAALELLQRLQADKRSEAPAFFYAQLLNECGDRNLARQQLQAIVDRYLRGTSVWRRLEHRWYLAAKQTLSNLK